MTTSATGSGAAHRIPSVVPPWLRNRLYAWHPARGWRWRRFPGIERVGASDLVLTFDDGPGKDATPDVLDALRREHVRATFFVLGSEVLAEPALARRIVEEGHELGLHGFAHFRYDKAPVEAVREDLERGRTAVEEATGKRPRWVRPPFGRLSRGSHAVCCELGLEIAYWSAWGIDWEPVEAERIEREVCACLHGGAIVLLHDTSRYGRRSSAMATVQALRAIVHRGRGTGLTWCTLSEAVIRRVA